VAVPTFRTVTIWLTLVPVRTFPNWMSVASTSMSGVGGVTPSPERLITVGFAPVSLLVRMTAPESAPAWVGVNRTSILKLGSGAQGETVAVLGAIMENPPTVPVSMPKLSTKRFALPTLLTVNWSVFCVPVLTDPKSREVGDTWIPPLGRG
jgi:hypothetical protein